MVAAVLDGEHAKEILFPQGFHGLSLEMTKRCKPLVNAAWGWMCIKKNVYGCIFVLENNGK